jgi:hypothetical protein
VSDDWHVIYDDEKPKPDWLDDTQIVFVRDSFGYGEGYGPIPADMVNWKAVSQFRVATAETTFR